MPCSDGCLCVACCHVARNFGFDHWSLDRPYKRHSLAELEPRLVSRRGHWFDPADDGYEPVTAAA